MVWCRLSRFTSCLYMKLCLDIFVLLFYCSLIQYGLIDRLIMWRVSDTENIRFVFAAVKDTILQLNLKEYNLVWRTTSCDAAARPPACRGAVHQHTRQHAYQPFNFFLSAAPCRQSLYHQRWHNADRFNAGSAPFGGLPVDNFCVQYARRLSTGWLFCGVDVPRACVKYNVVVLTVRSFRLRLRWRSDVTTRRRTRGVYIHTQSRVDFCIWLFWCCRRRHTLFCCCCRRCCGFWARAAARESAGRRLLFDVIIVN